MNLLAGILKYDATKINADGTQEEYKGEGLEPMQKAVSGLVEGFYVDGLRCYCNEEGLYREDLNLNKLFTDNGLGYIKGNIVAFKSREAESRHFN